MDEIFGNLEITNETISASSSPAHIYSADEIALILAGLGGCVATMVYSFKNIKHSSCCLGLLSCDQRTELPPSKESMIIESSNV